ncbi:MAG TPA: hypothetical protein VL357_08500 [Rariglobus sp.]|jgi:hypothetical protein|nr:hypothetical protein [Rariglobus sp.]
MLRRLSQFIAVLAVASATTLSAALVDTRSVEAAPVVSVRSTRVADIVLLGAGFTAGLRQGMVCSITRGNTDVAEIVLVDLRPHAGAALILQLAPGQSIRPGDVATVKTLKA